MAQEQDGRYKLTREQVGQGTGWPLGNNLAREQVGENELARNKLPGTSWG